MRALLATFMIVLAVCFTGCSKDDGGGDAEKPAAEETTDEATE